MIRCDDHVLKFDRFKRKLVASSFKKGDIISENFAVITNLTTIPTFQFLRYRSQYLKKYTYSHYIIQTNFSVFKFP